MVTSVSTVPAVQRAFVTAVDAEVPTGVSVHRAWPGPDATPKMVFLTDVDWQFTEEAAIKAGRRFRNESYDANFEVWVLAESASPITAGDTLDELFTIYNAVEEAVVKAGSTVQAVDGLVSVTCSPSLVDVVTFNKGWGAAMRARLSVTARLT